MITNARHLFVTTTKQQMTSYPVCVGVLAKWWLWFTKIRLPG